MQTSPLLFDLTADPSEKYNIAEQHLRLIAWVERTSSSSVTMKPVDYIFNKGNSIGLNVFSDKNSPALRFRTVGAIAGDRRMGYRVNALPQGDAAAVPVGTVMSRLSRARNRVRAQLRTEPTRRRR